LSLIKGIYQIPITNSILTEVFEALLLKSDRRELCILSPVTFYLEHHCKMRKTNKNNGGGIVLLCAGSHDCMEFKDVCRYTNLRTQ
jgi:hypothetical protein